MKLFLANDLVVNRGEGVDVKPPAPEPTPDPDPEVTTQPAVGKSLLEKAVETVEEVVKPKRRGRPKKKTTD